MTKKTPKKTAAAAGPDPLNAVVRTDTSAAMRKLALLGRICVAYELITRHTTFGDIDASAVLELREVLGRLITMNHDVGHRYAKILLGQIRSGPRARALRAV